MSKLKKYKETYSKNTKLFWFLLLYVSFGTVAVCSLYVDDYFNGDWAFWGWILSFPVTIVSFAFRYGNPDNLIPVFIIQVTTFIVAFTLFSKRSK